MFVHIGCDIEIPSKDIISIINIYTINQSKINQEFIRIAEEDGFTIKIGEDEPKSIVIVNEDDKYTLYFSPIKSSTLQHRLKFVDTQISYQKEIDF